MGASFAAYLLKEAELRAVFGSGNCRVAEEVAARYSSEFGHYEEVNALQSGQYRIIEALNHILIAHIDESLGGPVYGYALYYLCRFLGDELDCSGFEEITHDISVVLDDPTMRDVADALFSHPIEWLPFPAIEDFPLISHVTADEARILLKDLPEVSASDDALASDRKHVVEQFQDWLRRAADQDKDIVIFFA